MGQESEETPLWDIKPDGFILGGHVTAAHVADISQFDQLLAESNLAPDSLVAADKGYGEEKSYIDGIMYKAARGKSLAFIRHLTNRLISSVRHRLEQTVGTLKRRYGFSRMRYKGIMKASRMMGT
ncbi:MAG: transposase [Syntrophorhabdus sp.]